jgi:hypothetical protein
VSRLIANLLLSVLLIPLAGVVYLIAFFFSDHRRNGRVDEETSMIIGGLSAWTFIAFYWICLWRKNITWSNRRLTLTCFSFFAAAMLAIVLGAFTASVQEEVGYFIGTMAAPLIWLVGTILIWRETETERAVRLAAATGKEKVVCPTCGYNMSGLKSTQCPECGSEFTLDALIAAQPSLAQAEVEQ